MGIGNKTFQLINNREACSDINVRVVLDQEQVVLYYDE